MATALERLGNPQRQKELPLKVAQWSQALDSWRSLRFG